MLSNKRVLVTGTNSGLGKFIADSLESCLCLTRENKDEIIKECKENPVDVIIHSAFNSSRYIRNYDEYFEDNISTFIISITWSSRLYHLLYCSNNVVEDTV